MVIAPEIGIESYISIDLSIRKYFFDVMSNNLRSSSSFSNYINAYLESHSKQIAYGGYLERRLLYSRSIHFNTNKNHQRDIHLGIDLWCVVNTAVTAAFCGRIHSFKNNTNFGDYGPTIIIEHQFEEFQFFTLYGHLSLASIAALEVGQHIKAGEVIGFLGSSKVNGDYPPHLHFQIIKDLQGNFGDYPGVCNSRSLDFYKNNCPDPSLILKLEG